MEQSAKKNKQLDLFLTFAKVGICTFGGGYAILPMLEKEVVNSKNWATMDEIMDYYVVGQCTPGIIAVNTATFIGRKIGGLLGGIVATLGLVFPSYVIICIVSAVLRGFMEIEMVQHAFNGIRVAVCALVIKVIVGMIKKSVKNALCVILLLASFTATVCFGISPVIIIIACLIIGLVFGEDGSKDGEKQS